MRKESERDSKSVCVFVCECERERERERERKPINVNSICTPCHRALEHFVIQTLFWFNTEKLGIFVRNIFFVSIKRPNSIKSI